ncbi:MAG: GLPGLI family protein [Capnocytophaga sp.]|nr:GLPGLI family protein [Capnocytophaga sp.]
MKCKFIISILALFVGVTHLKAQSGIITYTGHINKQYSEKFLKSLNDDKNTPADVLQTITLWHNTAKPVELELRFKGSESFYEFIPDLNSDGGYNISETLTGSYMPYYTNSKSNTIIEFNPFVGNTVIDQPLEWNITPEMKKIGKYNCIKAVAYEQRPSRKGGFFTDKVIAWFTTEIPVNFAPRRYNGLPGLVLEVEKDRYIITATKIVLNPKKEVVLNVPEIGRTITQSEQYKRYEEREKERQRERANQK